MAHKHYWKLAGKGRRWFNGHALASCVRCPAVTVVEYGSYTPCEHAVGREIGFLSVPRSAHELWQAYDEARKREELTACPKCGSPREEGVCANCPSEG